LLLICTERYRYPHYLYRCTGLSWKKWTKRFSNKIWQSHEILLQIKS